MEPLITTCLVNAKTDRDGDRVLCIQSLFGSPMTVPRSHLAAETVVGATDARSDNVREILLWIRRLRVSTIIGEDGRNIDDEKPTEVVPAASQQKMLCLNNE